MLSCCAKMAVKGEKTMKQEIRESIQRSVQSFSLPKYNEIPNVGLYLEQTSQYISEYYAVLGDFSLTGSMISNYVKKGLIANPVKKKYDREQIAYLFFIAVAKTVLSMEDIRMLVQIQKQSYSSQKAYDYFCAEMKNVLFYVFGMQDNMDSVGHDDTLEKDMLRNTIIAIAHKVYLDRYFAALHDEGK